MADKKPPMNPHIQMLRERSDSRPDRELTAATERALRGVRTLRFKTPTATPPEPPKAA